MTIPTALLPLALALGVTFRVFTPDSDDRAIGLTPLGCFLLDVIEFLGAGP